MSRPVGDAIRVLHVDDDPDLADLTTTFLEREDGRIAVETATSASEGLELLETGEFDCVVSDYDMPGRNGIEFLESVRAEFPELPFVLFTGKGSEEVASEAISAGVTDYLQKESGTDQYTVLANRIVNAVEHDRSRRQVQRSERRLREIVDSLPHLLYVVDETGTYLLGNRALAEFHGTTVAELEGEDVDDVLDERTARRFREDLDGVLESETRERIPEVEVTDADGESHVFEPTLLPYDLAETDDRAVLGIALDVTDRTESERELERTNSLLSTLFDTLPVGVLTEDESRNVLAVNDRLLDLFGFPDGPDAVVGADCERLARDVSDAFVDSTGFVDRIDELVSEREPVRGETLRLRDGRTFARSYRPIELTDGQGHLWVYRDVTGADDGGSEPARDRR